MTPPKQTTGVGLTSDQLFSPSEQAYQTHPTASHHGRATTAANGMVSAAATEPAM